MEIQKNIFILEKFLFNMIALWKNQISNIPLQIELIASDTETKINTDISILSLALDFFIRNITNNFQSKGFITVKVINNDDFHIIQFKIIGLKKNKINIANEQISDILTELKITINDNSFRKGEYQFNIPTSTFEIPDLSLNKIKPIPKKSQNPKINAEIEKSYTILIVEDELPLIEMLSDILGNFYKIHTAYNGLNAIELLKQNPIDIILSDIEMPDMNGMDMLEEIRKNPEYAPIPIIFLTAFDIPKLRLKGFEGGAQDYIVKPVNNRELLARIRVHLKQRELYREVQDLKLRMNKKGLSIETSEKIRLLIEYIDKNFDEQLTRDNLAQTIGLSADHMSRVFLELTGKKIGDYINHRRIEFAMKKLRSSDDTIISIANEAGFESLRTFNRVFLKEFKENPANYRQKNRPE